MVKIIQITNSIKNVFFDSIRFFLILLLIFTFCLWGCSCKKENNEPEQKKPEPTTDGRNTFYCEINGVPYYQKFVSGLSDFPRISGSYSLLDSGHALNFTASYANKDLNFLITYRGKKIKPENLISFGKNFRDSYFNYSNSKNNCFYANAINPYNTYSGSIFFTRFDPKNSIYSGHFDFKIWLPDSIKGSCDSVKVTNGIFDLKL